MGNCRARQSWGKEKGEDSSISPALGLAEGIGEVRMEPRQYQQGPSSSVPAQCLLCGWSWDTVSPAHVSVRMYRRIPFTTSSVSSLSRTMS